MRLASRRKPTVADVLTSGLRSRLVKRRHDLIHTEGVTGPIPVPVHMRFLLSSRSRHNREVQQ